MSVIPRRLRVLQQAAHRSAQLTDLSQYKTGRFKWQGAGEFRSVAYQSEGFDVDQNRDQDGWITLTLSKIGTMTVRAHRDVPDTEDIKRIILKKDRTGEWYACFVVEVEPLDLTDDRQRIATTLFRQYGSGIGRINTCDFVDYLMYFRNYCDRQRGGRSRSKMEGP